MAKISFIVLHYKDFAVTQKCVDSILRLKNFNNNNVLIIDNASNNDSGEKLKKEHQENKNIDVIILNESNGFSKANNLGYKFCQERYNPDIYVFTNNDVIFSQKEFIIELERSYYEDEFDILGPDILDVNSSTHVNPMPLSIPTLDEAKKYLKESEYKLKHPYYSCFLETSREKISDLKRRVNNVLKLKKRSEQWKSKHEDVYLWGACIIFGKKFFEKRELPFYPETFFYHEEQILLYNAKRMGMRVLYNPCLSVLHQHGVATKSAFDKIIQRKKFQWQNNCAGTKVFIRMLEKDGE